MGVFFDDNGDVSLGGGIVGVFLGIIAIIGVIIGIDAATSFSRTDGGSVAVVRNGGPFDNSKIRQVLPVASGRTYTGLNSSVHKYPATQRYYTITSDPKRGDRTGVDVVSVPSSDGVQMGIEGTFYFTLNTDKGTLEAFDNKFGTRKFLGQDGKSRYPWSGDDGWDSFLDTQIRPVIDNDLRAQVNNFPCAELVSSCALVQNGTFNPNRTTVHVKSNNGNIAAVQSAINSSFEADLRSSLGGEFMTNVHFILSKVTLPSNVQDAVDKAQAAFAQVSEAQAQIAQAAAAAQAQEQKQKGYNACRTCAEVDTLKALPQGLTTLVLPNGSTGLSLAVPAGK